MMIYVDDKIQMDARLKNHLGLKKYVRKGVLFTTAASLYNKNLIICSSRKVKVLSLRNLRIFSNGPRTNENGRLLSLWLRFITAIIFQTYFRIRWKQIKNKLCTRAILYSIAFTSRGRRGEILSLHGGNLKRYRHTHFKSRRGQHARFSFVTRASGRGPFKFKKRYKAPLQIY